jgi:peptidylprolyl isomerase
MVSTMSAFGGKLEITIKGEGANGIVVIDLFEEIAPLHVERMLALASNGNYDGIVFHRVIEGFMAQTGDVEFGNSSNDKYNLGRAGTGGSSLN